MTGRLYFRLTPAAGSELTALASVYVGENVNQLQFELAAGNKAGDFTIAVQPFTAVGTTVKMAAPFQLKVRVK